MLYFKVYLIRHVPQLKNFRFPFVENIDRREYFKGIPEVWDSYTFSIQAYYIGTI